MGVWTPLNDLGVFLNQVPVGSIRLGEREWVSRFATVTEVYDSLVTTVNTIRENVTEMGAIIFTLSPVPLKYTASSLSIREANNLSKSTLLVALQQLILNRPDIDYFPSYEVVQSLTEQLDKSVWQVDGRHVSARVIVSFKSLLSDFSIIAPR